jgi:hypothetical protein
MHVSCAVSNYENDITQCLCKSNITDYIFAGLSSFHSASVNASTYHTMRRTFYDAILACQCHNASGRRDISSEGARFLLHARSEEMTSLWSNCKTELSQYYILISTAQICQARMRNVQSQSRSEYVKQLLRHSLCQWGRLARGYLSGYTTRGHTSTLDPVYRERFVR